jgi:hypothetical protein
MVSSEYELIAYGVLATRVISSRRDWLSFIILKFYPLKQLLLWTDFSLVKPTSISTKILISPNMREMMGF